MDYLLIALLNGVSYGLLLFMLSAGLTLILSLMGVLNFAHAGFYMLGAYLGYALSGVLGYWAALLLVPPVVALLGAGFEVGCLRRVRRAHGGGGAQRFGHAAELLLTFGLSYLILELVQLLWGRSTVPYALPDALQGPAFTLYGTQFPRSRAFVMAVALAMLGALWLLLRHTRVGLVITAALTHPQMVQALGHDVPRVFTGVFAGGCALAALAGVIGGNTYVTEPGMAMALGPIVFVVVVVGGLGSLVGAFAASLLIGLVQTFAVAAGPAAARLAPILPYLLMVAVLVMRPQGLMGRRAA